MAVDGCGFRTEAVQCGGTATKCQSKYDGYACTSGILGDV